ncbi:MAG: RluA family pseudouridine synthase [Bacteroidota bacterium]
MSRQPIEKKEIQTPVIIYEDNHIIAINKRPSEIVQGDKTGDIPLSELLKIYIKNKYHKPGNVFCGVVHRLDRPASGVVLFAKTSKGLTRLNKIFHDKEIKKTYWAVVAKSPEHPQKKLSHYLLRNEKQNISRVVSEGTTGAQLAELEYEIIANAGNYFLLQINLITGRHHQIRAQLGAIGCPIMGDNKYGYPRNNRDYSIHLHARKIEFIHPVSKETIVITAIPHEDVVWKKFENII